MHYRAIFISDLHLGSRGAQATAVTDFLSAHTSDYLYLVGDIVDGWALRRRAFFPADHQVVVRKILKRATTGTQVFYTPGNHDEIVRTYSPLALENIHVADEFTHATADGRHLLVIHGDQYDQVVKYAKWVALLGDVGYSLLLRSNRYLNVIRRRLGYGYWSLSAYLKKRVKTAVSFIGEYEKAVVHSVRDRGLDGVICGHIHHAEQRTMDGVEYMNCGDWVETCSALVEHTDGRIELLFWNVDQDAARIEVAEAA